MVLNQVPKHNRIGVQLENVIVSKRELQADSRNVDEEPKLLLEWGSEREGTCARSELVGRSVGSLLCRSCNIFLELSQKD